MKQFKGPPDKGSYTARLPHVRGIFSCEIDLRRKFVNCLKTTLVVGVLCSGLIASAVHAGAQDEENGKPTTLTFKYIGDSCDAWFNDQDHRVSCIDYSSGAPDEASEEVRIVAHEAHGKQRVWFDGIVEQGKDFTIDAMNGERTTFTGGSIVFEIFDLQDTPLQEVEIGIGGSNSLIIGDLYGSLILKKVNYKFKIPKEYEDFSQYIVSFNEEVSWDDVEDYAEYWEIYGVNIAMELPLLNSLVLKIPAYVNIDELADDPRVAALEYDQELGVRELLDGQGRSFIRPLKHKPEKLDKYTYEYPWSVIKLYDQLHDDYSTDSPSSWLNKDAVPELIRLALKELDKAKLRIAFFDTGIEKNHKKAGSKLKGGLDIVNGRNNNGKFKSNKPIDDNGHGTHVAGILATILDNNHEWGKGAKIEVYAIKVLDQYATGKLSNILMGLQWAVDNDIDIVNMSIGYRHSSPAIHRAIQETAQAGLIIVASVGNHTNYDDSVVLQGLAEGGAAEGGAAEGGAAEGGAAEGGAAEGGAAEGGAAEGGAAEGGAAEGGAAEGGAAEGGAAEGGAAEGGAAEGGAAEGGAAEGGAAEGGAAEGGAAEGGAAEGGAAEGGAAEGGAAEGGAAEGGAAEGGAAEGGAAEGGAAEGGAAEGGAAEGGAAEGGAAEGGAAEGGAAEGGAAEGGAAEGGAGDVTQSVTTQPLPLYSVMYPARYPEVIAVGSSDQWGDLAPFSNSGEEMDIMAPGVDILSWDITNGDEEEGLGSTSGTSMSAPYVTAAVALMLALDPTLNAQEIRDILRQTAHYNSVYVPAGDLNLVGVLDEVMFRLLGQDPAALDRKELKKRYREQLKEKIRSIGDTLWE